MKKCEGKPTPGAGGDHGVKIWFDIVSPGGIFCLTE